MFRGYYCDTLVRKLLAMLVNALKYYGHYITDHRDMVKAWYIGETSKSQATKKQTKHLICTEIYQQLVLPMCLMVQKQNGYMEQTQNIFHYFTKKC